MAMKRFLTQKTRLYSYRLLALALSLNFLLVSCNPVEDLGAGTSKTTTASTRVLSEPDTTVSTETEQSVVTQTTPTTVPSTVSEAGESSEIPAPAGDQTDESPERYKTFYEIFPYSFYDTDGDGIGDLQGIIERLDYVQDGELSALDLGATGIWLMPIMPSPTYHKYDVTDYYDIDPDYGTLEDFDMLIADASSRDIDIIIDLVLNHTSSEHPWFLEATEALSKNTDSPYTNYYHFSEVKNSDTWFPIPASDLFYEGAFWSGMPDLNLDSPDLRDEIIDIASFWLERGVAGFRLDATTHFHSGDHAKNIEFLAWFNDTVKDLFPDTYIVAEAWEGFAVYNSYLSSGIDSAFDFVFADTLGLTMKAIHAENGNEYSDAQIEADTKRREINDHAINAPFLTNHDTGRLAGFAASDLNKIRLAQRLNILAPGNTFIYYGEELGFRGAGRDENKRAPMLWSNDDSGLTNGPPGMDASRIGYPFGSVEDQRTDPDSILSHVRETIRFKQRYPALSAGALSNVVSEAPKEVAVEARTYNGETFYLLTNFSASDLIIDLADSELADTTILDQLGFNDSIARIEAQQLTLPGYQTILLVD